MKKLCLPFILMFLFLNCDREWDNPLSTDDDLKNRPNIIQIKLDSEKNISIILNYAYTDSSSTVLERKSVGGYEKINYVKQTQTTLLDTSFDKEISHNFVYRVSVVKDEYRSSYSDEKAFVFTSTGLNKPENLLAVSVELQGIRLEWKDESNYEDSYIVEKNEGSGFTEIATLSSNTESYFDAISGTPPSPLQLEYRVKAISSDLESNWVTASTVYSGLGSPTNLRITNTSAYNFTIEWDDNSSIETGYLIEKKIDSGSFTQLVEVNANSTTYSDTITVVGIYSYRVRAKQYNNYSSYSNEVSYDITSLFPTDGLVAYYPFNGNAIDESGNGNDGTVIGAILTADRFNNENSAHSFDGYDDYIEIESSSSLQISSSYTISAWIYHYSYTADGESMGILSKGSPGEAASVNHNYAIVMENEVYFHHGVDATIVNLFEDSGGINYQTYFDITVQNFPLNNWHHVLALFNDEENTLDVYVNNTQGLHKTSINTIPIMNNQKVRIGDIQTSNGKKWQGLIDDIRIYNRALNDSEIRDLYHEGGWGE